MIICRIIFSISLYVSLTILCTSCALPHQIKEYKSYQIHDIKVSKRGLNVFLEKKLSSPEISVPKAIFGKVPTRARYRIISYALLIFNEKKINTNNKYINFDKKINIVTKKEIRGMNRISIINDHSVLSWSDFINDIKNTSIIFIKNDKRNLKITENDNEIYFSKSFNNQKIMYLLNDKMFIYDLESYSKVEFNNGLTNNNYYDLFKNTNYMTNDGKWFFDRVGEDLSIMSYIYEIVDKENNIVFGRFPTKSRNFQDFKGSLQDGRLLTYDFRYGLEIIDLKGNSLYSLQDDSFKYIRNAVFHNDKVYAVGITTESSEFGKKDYIEIIQWDYKNDSVIKKYYPCDSPELEM